MKVRWCEWVLASFLVAGCSVFGTSKSGDDTASGPERRAVVVEMPWETTKVRDNGDAPAVSVALMDDGVDGVPVPYIYGYPIYGRGQAMEGVLKLRTDNYEGASRDVQTDEHGVLIRTEELPQLGCHIEGFEETERKFVPVVLRCEMPPPRAYGGKKRSVIGSLKAGARVEQVVAEPSLKEAFLGDWHLLEGDPDGAKAVGYFNTEHGQLAFEFEKGRLGAVAYYFDPSQKQWQQPTLWAVP